MVRRGNVGRGFRDVEGAVPYNTDGTLVADRGQSRTPVPTRFARCIIVGRGSRAIRRKHKQFKGKLFVFGDYSSVAYGATFPHTPTKGRAGRLTDSKHSAIDG